MQVKDMLLPFGELKAFNLVMDKTTGNSKVCPAHEVKLKDYVEATAYVISSCDIEQLHFCSGVCICGAA